jgi:hypothetical protein
MKYYYLLNGKIMSANDKMPQGEDYVSLNPTHFNKLDFDIDAKQWLNSLQPCEISESELCLILSNVTKLDYDNPIEVTDIVNASVICKVERCDGECIECNHMAIRIVFKQPKQVEEIEAIYTEKQVDELIETICFRLRSGHFKTLDLKLSAINRIKNEIIRIGKTKYLKIRNN